jgi:hypothetical protein
VTNANPRLIAKDLQIPLVFIRRPYSVFALSGGSVKSFAQSFLKIEDFDESASITRIMPREKVLLREVFEFIWPCIALEAVGRGWHPWGHPQHFTTSAHGAGS